jgi:hypothetical protein
VEREIHHHNACIVQAAATQDPSSVPRSRNNNQGGTVQL